MAAPQLGRKIVDQTRQLACFPCFFSWEPSARTAHQFHFKPRAPQKSDRGTQRKPRNLTKMVLQGLVAVLGPMFSIVGWRLAGWCWLVGAGYRVW